MLVVLKKYLLPKFDDKTIRWQSLDIYNFWPENCFQHGWFTLGQSIIAMCYEKRCAAKIWWHHNNSAADCLRQIQLQIVAHHDVSTTKQCDPRPLRVQIITATTTAFCKEVLHSHDEKIVNPVSQGYTNCNTLFYFIMTTNVII